MCDIHSGDIPKEEGTYLELYKELLKDIKESAGSKITNQSFRNIKMRVFNLGSNSFLMLPFFLLTMSEFIGYKACEGEFPVVNEIDVAIITGSPHGVYEKLDWMLRLEELIRKLKENKKVIIGGW